MLAERQLLNRLIRLDMDRSWMQVLYVPVLLPFKGHDEMLNAFGLSRKQNLNTKKTAI